MVEHLTPLIKKVYNFSLLGISKFYVQIHFAINSSFMYLELYKDPSIVAFFLTRVDL